MSNVRMKTQFCRELIRMTGSVIQSPEFSDTIALNTIILLLATRESVEDFLRRLVWFGWAPERVFQLLEDAETRRLSMFTYDDDESFDPNFLLLVSDVSKGLAGVIKKGWDPGLTEPASLEKLFIDPRWQDRFGYDSFEKYHDQLIAKISALNESPENYFPAQLAFFKLVGSLGSNEIDKVLASFDIKAQNLWKLVFGCDQAKDHLSGFYIKEYLGFKSGLVNSEDFKKSLAVYSAVRTWENSGSSLDAEILYASLVVDV